MVSRAVRTRFSSLQNLSVRMLCRRSASLMMTTRMSFAIAKNILRSDSAFCSSLVRNSMPSSLVTPSTRCATSEPNCASMVSNDALVSSMQSCSSAATMVV